MIETREFATWGVDEPLRVRKWVPLEEHEAEIAARAQTARDLGFQLGMAEEGLANYAQENERLRALLRSCQVNAVIPGELESDIEHAIGEVPEHG